MDEPIGPNAATLTLADLQRALDHLRNACPGCGGKGYYISEGFEHWNARILTAIHVRGAYTFGESLLREKVCPACGGTGQKPA